MCSMVLPAFQRWGDSAKELDVLVIVMGCASLSVIWAWYFTKQEVGYTELLHKKQAILYFLSLLFKNKVFLKEDFEFSFCLVGELLFCYSEVEEIWGCWNKYRGVLGIPMKLFKAISASTW